MPRSRLAITFRPTTVSDYLPHFVVSYFLQTTSRLQLGNSRVQSRLTLGIVVDDVSTLQNSKQITGHGTFVAALAAGCKTGVARKANLYLIKMIDVMMKEGLVEETFSGPTAQLQGLRHVASVIQGFVAGVSATRGKAILVMCAGNWREDNMRSQYGATWDNTKALMKIALERLDGLGVTIVMTAGNDGGTPRYIDQQFPQGIATADSPMILVGATNSKGRLSPFSSPGRGNIPVSLYAQGEGVSTYDLLQSGRKLKYGTSYAAPIVVCAVNLKYPEFVLLTCLGWPGCLHPRPAFQPVPVQPNASCRRRFGGNVHEEISNKDCVPAG